MTSLKLFYAGECRRIPHAPKTIQELREKLKEMFGIDNPIIQYRDEENDLITIQTQYEYIEPITSAFAKPLKLQISNAMDFASILASVPLCNSDAGHESDEDIEFLSSEPIDTGTDAIILNLAEKSVETAKIESKEDGNLAFTPQTSEQASNANVVTEEKGIITTGFQTVDESCSSKVETSESGCDAKKFISKNIETVPLKIESVESETIHIPMHENSSNTNQMKDSGVSPIKKSEIGFQKIEAIPDLLQSLRSIIREEIGNLDKLKLSGLQTVHQVECKQCHTKPIIGIRYKCQECDISLCEACEDIFDHEHPMYKMKKVEDLIKPPPPPPVVNIPYKIPDNIFPPPINSHMLPSIQPVQKAPLYEIPKSNPPQPIPLKYPEFEPIKKSHPLDEINQVSANSERFQKAKILMDLGFKDANKNRVALEKANYNIDQAVEILLDE
ncbi:unnamed protein product [Blepharisma stoltei]|uniref:Uncharacterized protein n=1 Tax=Blepharisma stoltei TaxID=1481888 RepID=A0AAU9JFY8_9CILI|nr:unnamed protein product [Blepharisma stoltei]